jgi:hypothetical protein
MASKKAKTPQEQALIKKRVEFVQSKPNIPKAQARQQFFVQTRAAELQAKGVEVTKEKRAQLRQKFQSGEVKRSGFYTDADRARFATSKSGSTDTGGFVQGKAVAQTGGFVSSSMRKPISDFKAGNVQASSIKKSTNPVSAVFGTVKDAFNPKAKNDYNTWAEQKAAQGGVDLSGALNIAITAAQVGSALVQARKGNLGRLTGLFSKAPTFTKPPAGRPTGPVTSGSKPSNVTVTGPGRGRSFYDNLNRGRTQTYKGQKPGSVDLVPGLKPVKPTKPTKPAASAKPAAASKPTAAAKPKSRSKSQAQMQAKADSAVSGGVAKALKPNAAPANVTNPFAGNSPAAARTAAANINAQTKAARTASAKPATTAKPAAKKPSAVKTTRAKAQAGTNFNKKVKQVNSGPRETISDKIKKYESQEAFDKFMNSGGKQIVTQAAKANPKVGEAFTEANREFIAARSARKTSQAALRKKREIRKQGAVIRLNKFREYQAAKAEGK